MIAEVLIASILLQQQQTFQLNLNFSEIGSTWKSDALYILYNRNTTTERNLFDTTDHILENGKGYFAQKPFIVADLVSSESLLKDLDTYTVSSLVVVMMNDWLDPAWERANQIMRFIKAAFTIFIVRKDIGKEQELQQFFYKLHKQEFTRVLVVVVEYMQQQLFTMKPYPKLEITNVTGKLPIDYFNPLENWDLQGYTLRVPVQMDVPNIFWYYDGQSKRIRLDGLGGRLFEHFMEAMNVTLDVYPLYVNGLNYLNMSHIEDMIMRGEIEISPHLYTTFETKDLQYSYPFMSTPRCIMLPLDSGKWIEIIPIFWTLWLMVLVVVAVFEIACYLAMNYFGSSKRLDRYRVFRTPGAITYNTICLLINFPMPDMKIVTVQNVPLYGFLRTIFIYAIVTTAGFWFSQIHSTTVTSQVAISLSFKLHSTPKDILNMNVPIMVLREDAKYLLGVPGFGRMNLATRLHYADSYEEFHKNRLSFNTSFMYPISRERWQLLRGQQLHLKVKRFWLSDVCYGGYPVQYQMRYDSYFMPYLRKYILFVRESGLYMYWRRRDLWRALELGYLRYIEEDGQSAVDQKRQNIIFSMGQIMAYVYYGGISLSVVVLGLELMCKMLWKAPKAPMAGVKVRIRAGRPIKKFNRF